MLDVHPPHQPTHTWKDFFIHIATIVVGLLIAVGLEQTVEAIHQREQRAQLREDLRREAEGRVSAIRYNIRIHAALGDWYRETLQAALKAELAGGFVSFVVPPKPPPAYDYKPESAVWDAAKAAGLARLLERSEIEAWNRDNLSSEITQRRVETWNADWRALLATADHLGVKLEPGETIRVTVSGRDELTRALGTVMEDVRAVNRGDALTAGTSEAILHGASTAEQMEPYIRASALTIPK